MFLEVTNNPCVIFCTPNSRGFFNYYHTIRMFDRRVQPRRLTEAEAQGGLTQTTLATEERGGSGREAELESEAKPFDLST